VELVDGLDMRNREKLLVNSGRENAIIGHLNWEIRIALTAVCLLESFGEESRSTI
jgi:hypothetical protein